MLLDGVLVVDVFDDGMFVDVVPLVLLVLEAGAPLMPGVVEFIFVEEFVIESVEPDAGAVLPGLVSCC